MQSQAQRANFASVFNQFAVIYRQRTGTAVPKMPGLLKGMPGLLKGDTIYFGLRGLDTVQLAVYLASIKEF